MRDHPELESEQAYFDAAYEWRERRRQGLGSLDDVAADPKAWAELKRMQEHWREEMGDPSSGVAFGRIDTDERETYYIGYEPVWDDQRDDLVISWKAPIAQHWYRATHTDPQSLRRRRQFVAEGNTIQEILDIVFDEELLGEVVAVPEFRDALLADLERGRTGSMDDIVQTIQARQDEIMRAPLDRVLVVQGGPGTGKTVVALHRAAVLLYEHRDVLSDQRVLVVGPNPAFMHYVEKVLPTLGESAVTQLAIGALSPIRPVRLALDDEPSARLKGDVRMAEVIQRAVLDRQRVPDDRLYSVRAASRRFELDRDDLEEIVDRYRKSGMPHNTARDQVREELSRAFLASALPAPTQLGTPDVHHQILTSSDLENLAERVWPSLTAQALLQNLFTTTRRLGRATEGILTPAETRLLERTPGRKLADEMWSMADLALLDEADWLLNRATTRFGHVIVDEAQDLSPMQLRVISRRSLTGSLTVVGDLAQSTGAWTHESWESVIAHLPDDLEVQHEQLLSGYRVPRQIFDYAAQLLPVIAPAIAVPEAVREGPSDPRIQLVLEGSGLAEAILVTRDFAGDGNSVGVILPTARFAAAGEAFTSAGVSWADGRDRIGAGVTLVPASEAKGLEFDAVVVLEPADIAEEASTGLRMLYVALTRATRHLAIVHERPLPAPLGPVGEAEPPPPQGVRDEPIGDEGDDAIEWDESSRPPAAWTSRPPTSTLVERLVEEVAADLAGQAKKLTGPILWPEVAVAFARHLIGVTDGLATVPPVSDDDGVDGLGPLPDDVRRILSKASNGAPSNGSSAT